MPPSWTNLTDPNVAFDTKGRVYQTTLPFNAFWGGSTLHPDGAIDVSYSDEMGQHWVKGNGGQDLEQSPNASARQAGHVEDKQWIAVNDIAGSPNQTTSTRFGRYSIAQPPRSPGTYDTC